jgi:hypothetical protein
MTSTELTWLSAGHTHHPNDQLCALTGDYWATIGPDAGGNWAWSIRRADELVSTRSAPDEAAAKAAVARWEDVTGTLAAEIAARAATWAAGSPELHEDAWSEAVAIVSRSPYLEAGSTAHLKEGTSA